MTRASGLVLFAALALACGSTSAKPGARLARPSAVAVVQMRTTKVTALAGGKQVPAVHPYFAVASARTSELRLFDAWDDVAVLAPVAFYPLSVPTPLPRPATMAVAAVPSAAPPAPDALVVVPTGAAELQLVDTWSGSPRVVERLALDAVPGAEGGSILSILGTAVPVPGASGYSAANDAARFLVGLSGGRLAVVDVARDPVTGALSFGVPTVKVLGFDVVSLAAAPGDVATVYGASPDAIGGVYGAAAIDVTPPVANPWPVRALAARAPTTLVAAFDVVERARFDLGTFAIDGAQFGAAAVRRVYASLDPEVCGVDGPISCGIAILDPALGGLAADPSGEQPYAAPIPVPGMPAAIVPLGPPANPVTCPSDPRAADPAYPGCLYSPATLPSGADPSQSPARAIFVAGTPPLVLATLPLAAGAGLRWTPAAAAVPSSDGKTYVVDLARYGLPPDRSIIRGTTRTSVSLASTGPVDLQTLQPVRPRIGLVLTSWADAQQTSTTQSNELTDGGKVVQAVDVTPGYTPSDAWHVVWQGILPNLVSRSARLVRSASGLTVAVQVPNADAPAGAPAYLSVAQVYDPRLGVRAADTAAGAIGDVVQVTVPAAVATAETAPGSGVAICSAAVFDAAGNVTGSKAATSDVTFEAHVASLAPPAADHPGGALVLDGAGGPGPYVAGSTLVPGTCNFAAAQPDPTAAAPDGLAVTVTVRASALLLVGDRTGYAGRPTLGVRYEALRWQSEDALLPSCPLLSGSPAAACDGACRLACEKLVLARKARRLFYLDDACPKASASIIGSDSVARDPCVEADKGAPGFWPRATASGEVYAFPQPTGPVVAFQPVTLDTAPCTADPVQTCVVPSAAALGRDTFLSFVTQQGGLAWMSRRPASSGSVVGAAVPTGATAFDRSADPSRVVDGVRFVVTYPDNIVLDFTPGAGPSDVTLIR